MKTKTIIVALATLLIGSLCFQACQKDEILSGKPDMTEHIALKSGQAATVTDGDVKMVPFRGSGTYWYAGPPEVIVEIIDGEEVLVLVAVVKLEGRATRLGRLEGFETWRFRFDPEGPDGMFGDYLSHESTWIAANGDELHNEGSVEHGSVHEFYEPLGTGFSLTGVRIMRGTGRFENAAGWYDFWVTPTSDFGGTWEFEGEISN